MYRLSATAALVAALLPWTIAPAAAQGYFIPNAPHQAQPAPAQSRPAPRPSAPAQSARPAAPPVIANPQVPDSDQQPQLQVQLPPVPDLPALPRSTTPPTAVMGVIGVPEVMRASKAAQMVDRVIGERRDKLNEDAQKEQAAWRDMQQQLANQRSTMSPEQIRNRERDLQERITNAQKTFRDRNRVIQEAAQIGVGQIERTLVAVIRQVADSHGMNLVLHRQQVALNIADFDITDQVADQLNKVMPTVVIPPDGVSATAASPAAPSAPGATPAGGSAAPAAGPRR